MKHLSLTLTVAVLSCLRAFGQPFNFPIYGNFQYNLLGSQFDVLNAETLLTYSAHLPGGPEDGDFVMLWNVDLQDFDPTWPTYKSRPGTWYPNNPALPLGTAFMYCSVAGFDKNVVRGTAGAAVPIPAPALTPGKYYMLSSQQAKPASYGDLVGNPAAVPKNRTFVWFWEVPIADVHFPPFRYDKGVWQPDVPAVPLGMGALVGWYAKGDPGPAFTVQAAGSCAPNVTLTLTFTNLVDPLSKLTEPNSYAILAADQKTPCGKVNNVSPANYSTNMMFGYYIDFAVMGPDPYKVTAVLDVTLFSQPGNTYYVSGPGVLSMGGTPAAPMPFTLGTVQAPANDTPATAAPLTAGVPAYGSLTYANATPLGALQAVPAASGLDAKDVWYRFTPAASGLVTVTTCQPLQSSCPYTTDTVLAAYYGYTNALFPVVPWFNDDMAGCVPNPKASQLTFTATACTTYYIRLSAPHIGPLPGDFGLVLTHTPAAPANDLCGAATLVSANRSTPFDNYLATTDGPSGESVANDVWFRFQAPALGAAVVETCTANLDTALAVYEGACPPAGSLVAFNNDDPSCLPHSKVSFQATAGQWYYVRVGGATASDRGCGFLHVSCSIPPLGTLPPNGSVKSGDMFNIHGSAGGVGWSWSLTAPSPCGINIAGNVAGVAAGGSYAIAKAFANSINSFPPLVATAEASGWPELAHLTIYTPCPNAALVLKVGPEGGSPACWVDFSPHNINFPPCSFNPDMYQVGYPEGQDTDCNGNGQADYLDILRGVSHDANGNGIADECEDCVSVVVASGPDSVGGFLGGRATFAAQALGSGSLNYQWRKGGLPLATQTNVTLVLTNLTLEAAGVYDVVVTNACSQTTSAQAVLVMNPMPWLNVTRVGTNVVLFWSEADYHLQTAAALGGSPTWIDETNASPVTIPIGTGCQFFRLISP